MIRVLHVSDLHVADPVEADRRSLVEGMLDNAGLLAGEEGIDLVVFTGDLACNGKRGEYALARELLLEPAMKRFGIDRERVILVPGNHDVDRADIDDLVEGGIAGVANDPVGAQELLEDEGKLARARDRLRQWDEFVADFYGDAAPPEVSPMARVHELAIGDVTVKVAALDSAWRSVGMPEQDRGRLLLGRRQVEPALREIADADVRLVAVHHPRDWLLPADAESATIEFARQGAIVLAGHLHSPDGVLEHRPSGETLFVRAGCLYAHRTHPKSFSMLRLDPARNKIEIAFRRWYERRHAFDTDPEPAPEGRISFELPQPYRTEEMGMPPYAVANRRLGEIATELRIAPRDMTAPAEIAGVDDVLVEPRFFRQPHRDASLAARLTTDLAQQEIDPVPGIAENAVTVVSGMPQVGVSSAIYWLLARAYAADPTRMPAYLPARASNLRAGRAQAALASAAAQLGHRRVDAESPALTLGLDDLDLVSPRKRAKIADFIAENPGHRYVVGCHDDRWAAISELLAERGLTAQHVFLGAFGQRQLRALAAMVRGGESVDLSRVNAVLDEQQLPRTPFTMLALIAVLGNDREDAADLNETGVLEAYVKMLLGTEGPNGEAPAAMDFRKWAHLLGEIAQALGNRAGETMPAADAVSLVDEYFRRKGLPLAAAEVIDELVSRHVLVRVEEHVAFRHRSLLRLFMAHWAMEGADRRELVLGDCHGNRDVIRHMSGLRRSDRDCLESAREHLREIREHLGPEVTPAGVEVVLETVESAGPWQGERLAELPGLLPARQSTEQRDAEFDRIADALAWEAEAADDDAEGIAGELSEAVALLSDVLRHSELVDGTELKLEAFREAIEAWVMLVGVLAADAAEESFHALVVELLEHEASARGWPENERGEEMDAERLTLMVALMACAFAVEDRLGSRGLQPIVDRALDEDVFADAPAGACLTAWLHASLRFRGWPRRLGELLERLPRDSFLHHTTILVGAQHFRTTDDEAAARELLRLLAEQIVPFEGGGAERSAERDRRRPKVETALGNGRRAYQQQRPPEADAAPVARSPGGPRAAAAPGI